MKSVAREKLRLDFVPLFGLRACMPEDDDTYRELIARMFHLVTIVAEDVTVLAIEGQSRVLDQDQARETAVRLRNLCERIDILSAAIAKLGKSAT